MDAWKYGKPEYICDWCNQPNFEPDPQCQMCHRFQPGSRFDRLHGHDPTQTIVTGGKLPHPGCVSPRS